MITEKCTRKIWILLRRELSNGGLGIVVALPVCWQIDFSCASRWSAIRLYCVYRPMAPHLLPTLVKEGPMCNVEHPGQFRVF